MYDNNLPHGPASNQATHVLLACFPMSHSPIHAILICTLAEDHLYRDVSWEITHRSMSVDQITLYSFKYYAHNRVKGLIIPPKVVDIQQYA